MPPLHNVIRIQGTLPGGEVWSVNPKFIGDTTGPVSTFPALQEWAEAVGARVAAWPTSYRLRTMMSSVATINAIRAEYVGSDGRLLQAAEYVMPTPLAGNTTPTKPFQTAVVASLETGRPGRSYKGRLYWLGLGVAIGVSDLRISASDTQSIADTMAGFLTGVRDDAPDDRPLQLAVVSQTQNVGTPVNRITVGNVLDTQRRRRDALEEGRSVASFPSLPPG